MRLHLRNFSASSLTHFSSFNILLSFSPLSTKYFKSCEFDIFPVVVATAVTAVVVTAVVVTAVVVTAVVVVVYFIFSKARSFPVLLEIDIQLSTKATFQT